MQTAADLNSLTAESKIFIYNIFAESTLVTTTEPYISSTRSFAMYTSCHKSKADSMIQSSHDTSLQPLPHHHQQHVASVRPVLVTDREILRGNIFYSASALLTMQSAVLARGILSVCLFVCPSVTFRYCVQMNEDAIVQIAASGRTFPLVSGEVKFIRIVTGDHPQKGH